MLICCSGWRRVALLVIPAFAGIYLGLQASGQTASQPATAPAAQIDPRVPPRPQLTDKQYAEQAAELRKIYSQPPEKWPPARVDEGVKVVELGLVTEIPFPKDNPFTQEKSDLGKRLFFEPKLSGSGQISCANCHDPELAWGDGRSSSFGHDRQLGKRNAPTLMNIGLQQHLFWDGRAKSLEHQAGFPVEAEIEMKSTPEDVVKRLKDDGTYGKEFKAAFGDEEITWDRVAKSLATFQRTIKSGRSRFDAFLKGRHEALSDAAIRGLHIYRTEANCMNCHNGPNFSDGQFHNVGLSYYGRAFEDLGRYNITKKPEDVGAFRTPTLRNVENTGPLMHNGLFELDGVLNIYNAGMPTLERKEHQKDDPLFPTKSRHLRPLGLNARDLADLKAFLESLSEPRLRVRPPGVGPASRPATRSAN